MMRFRSVADVVTFSSLLPAGIAFSLAWVVSRAIEAPSGGRWAALASTGTFIVYNLDRLRDTVRDRETSPIRTSFIENHRRSLTISTALAGIVAAGLLLTAPRPILVLTLSIGAIGLIHRRIKRAAALKTLYVSLAWIGVCVGIPWLAAGRPESGIWVAAIILPILFANLVVSNLRDDETQLFRDRPVLVIRLALAFTLLGLLVVAISPPRLVAFSWLALAEGAAILCYRPGERYGLIVVDGALWVGAAIAALHLRVWG
jgi:hypothetical protein